MNTYITKIDVLKILHLEGFSIDFQGKPFKNLILTGKNGSGKTVLLNAIHSAINQSIGYSSNTKDDEVKTLGQDDSRPRQVNLNVKILPPPSIRCYFDSHRILKPQKPQLSILNTKITHTSPKLNSNKLLDFLFGLYLSQLNEEKKRNIDKSAKIAKWFWKFEETLRGCFEDATMEFEFDIEKRDYIIKQKGRETYNFNQLSDGFSAILSVVTEIIMRMGEDKYNAYDMSGIVFIDEVDIHLHLSLQKNVMPLLTSFFPNIQFIVTTHSPFVLTSIDNAVIYDLEHNIQINESIKGASYEAVVESFFKVDEFNEDVKTKIKRYGELIRNGEINQHKDEVLSLKTELEDKTKIPWLSKLLAGEFAELEIIRRKKMGV